MNWLMGGILAALAGATTAELVSRATTPPGLLIVCEMGGIGSDISHIASGAVCVLHDRTSATSAGAISVYSDDGAGP